MVWSVVAELARPVSAWKLDVSTAKRELEATAAQASVIAAHALAWRLALVLAPLSAFAAAVAVVVGDLHWQAILVAPGLGVFVPLLLAFVLSIPADWFGGLQTWYRGSRDARLRFGITNVVYPYYGWRYAARGRTRPWGALTREERLASNPARAGAPDPKPVRRNYWPE